MSSATRATDLVRRSATAIFAVIATISIAVASAFVGAVSWAATSVIIVPGTGTQHAENIPNYNDNIVDFFVKPTGTCAPSACDHESINYLAEFWPLPIPNWGGLDGAKWDDSVADGVKRLHEAFGRTDLNSPVVMFGYSQGSTVVSEAKKQYAAAGGVPENVSFVVIANPSRPNGGLFTRPSIFGHIPILDVTFGPGMPTNTSTTVNTTDIAFQYDTVADFPRYPINLLAVANALTGAVVHGTYLQPVGDTPGSRAAVYSSDEVKAMIAAATENCTAATYCQISGDTRYITIPAPILPIMLSVLRRADDAGLTPIARPLIDLLSPITRVLIETGYSREDYGNPTPFGILPTIYPIALGTDLLGAAFQGVRAAASGTGDASRYLERLRVEEEADKKAAAERESKATQTAADRPAAAELVGSTPPISSTPPTSSTPLAPAATPTAPDSLDVEQTETETPGPKTDEAPPVELADPTLTVPTTGEVAPADTVEVPAAA